MGRLVSREPDRLWENAEGGADDGLLGLVEHQGVVHDAGAGLDVLRGMAGEGSPGGDHEAVADGGPVVDGDGAVAQGGDSFFDGFLDFAVSQGGGVDDESGVEGSPEGFVGEGHGLLEVDGDAWSGDGGFGEDSAEGFGSVAEVFPALRVQAVDEGPGEAVFGFFSEVLGFGVGGVEGAPAVGGSGVPGSAQGCLLEKGAHGFQEVVSLR